MIQHVNVANLLLSSKKAAAVFLYVHTQFCLLNTNLWRELPATNRSLSPRTQCNDACRTHVPQCIDLIALRCLCFRIQGLLHIFMASPPKSSTRPLQKSSALHDTFSIIHSILPTWYRHLNNLSYASSASISSSHLEATT